jgi:hypothetical protein
VLFLLNCLGGNGVIGFYVLEDMCHLIQYVRCIQLSSLLINFASLFILLIREKYVSWTIDRICVCKYSTFISRNSSILILCDVMNHLLIYASFLTFVTPRFTSAFPTTGPMLDRFACSHGDSVSESGTVKSFRLLNLC